MDKKDVYLWFSGPTDITGRALVEVLGISGGVTKPSKNKKMVIGWGTKTKDSVVLGKNVIVMNHPNHIRDNRNKFKTLTILSDAKVPVAHFCSAKEVLTKLKSKKSDICLPLIGRTNFHQGGKNSWPCMTLGHVQNAIEEGAQYFQNFVDVKDEYRFHVFGGEVVYAVKKIKRSNMDEAFVNQQGAKIVDKAEKGKVKLDKTTMDYVLKTMAKNNPRADMVIRSNRRGWKFSHVSKYPQEFKKIAVDSVKAMGLDFGAVDCCISNDGTNYVFEINTGPGLEGKPLEIYVARFKKAIAEAGQPEKKEEIARGGVRSTVVKVTKEKDAGSNKERLRGMADMFSKMVETADEEEAGTISRVFERMMG